MNEAVPHESLSRTNLVDALVEERVCGDGRVTAVVCPSARGDRAHGSMRHVTCSALFQVPTGAVWMLRTTGHLWTGPRVAAASEILCAGRNAEFPIRNPILPAQLARALELPRVDVVAPVLDRLDASQWDTRRLALALRLQQLPNTGAEPEPAALAADVAALEGELISRLDAARKRFFDGLDGELLSAVLGNVGDARLLNFFTHAVHRRNRLQLAATFPILVPAAAEGDSDGAGGLVRRVVDAGLPLVATLAKEWAVSPSVLRGLRGRPVDVVGAPWARRIEALVAVLNALPAEFRPGHDAASWRAFNDYVAFAAGLFGRQPWTSPLALAWLRHAARRGWTEGVIAQASSDLGEQSLAAVDALRQALIDTLTAEYSLSATESTGDGVDAARVWHRVDQHLARHAPRPLIELAQRYRRELSAARSEMAVENEVACGTGFWPLLPEEYVSSDRSRIVVPLKSRFDLVRQGRALVNCLGTSHLDYYSAACARGNTFIVAVLDGRSRVPLSTAEVRIGLPSVPGLQQVMVAQHTAARNAPPTSACRRALREAIAKLGTEAGRQHMRKGLRAIAARHGDARGLQVEAERLAVRRAIGEAKYEELLRRIAGGS